MNKLLIQDDEVVEGLIYLNKIQFKNIVFKTISVFFDALLGEYVWVRPLFPQDYSMMKDCFLDNNRMNLWGPGLTKDEATLKSDYERFANSNIAFTSHWSVISYDGVVGLFLTLRSNTQRGTEVEIGYATRPLCQGRNISVKAGELILRNLYEYPNFVGWIFATAHPDNQASFQTMKKLGLTPDPERQFAPRYNSVRHYYQQEVSEPKVIKFSNANRPKA